MPPRASSPAPKPDRSRAANRRWRARRKQGTLLMTVEVEPSGLLAGLQDYGYLSRDRDSFKRNETVTALQQFLEDKVTVKWA